jgi:hypothetical protein
MFEILKILQQGKTTEFGYTVDCPRQYLNTHSVKALKKRGLLEQCGEMPWNGRSMPLYQISEVGKQALENK